MSYLLRYAFDPGSGVCLWAENEEAKERFGYAVEHSTLPIGENTMRFLDHLVAWFDTSIDWSSPSDTVDFWSTQELAHFKDAAAKGLAMLRNELSDLGFDFNDATDA